MARGKYERVVRHRKKQKKVFSLLLSIALLLTLAVGGTLAYIVTKSAMAQNQFVAGYVTSSVNEAGQVTNTGNVDAYIRAAVVVNWMDGDGNVYGIKPNCSLTTNTGWTEANGFYYYTSPVAANGTTTTAPVTVGDPGAAPSGAYGLSVEIVAEAIQAEGTLDSNDSITAVLDAWGLTPGGN
ncbi:MAG: hypothetical protein IKT52_01265 [Oscillospiraceae bacterium]|nr:hypothetical protein [Oscillospiraceae bacterium]